MRCLASWMQDLYWLGRIKAQCYRENYKQYHITRKFGDISLWWWKIYYIIKCRKENRWALQTFTTLSASPRDSHGQTALILDILVGRVAALVSPCLIILQRFSFSYESKHNTNMTLPLHSKGNRHIFFHCGWRNDLWNIFLNCIQKV